MAELNITRKGDFFDRVEFNVTGSHKVEQGHLLAVDSNGYALTASDASGRTVVGIGTSTKDNTSGDAGDLQVQAETGIFTLTLSGSADGSRDPNASDTGKMLYVINSSTVSFNSGSNSVKVGPARNVRSATEVDAEVGGASNIS